MEYWAVVVNLLALTASISGLAIDYETNTGRRLLENYEEQPSSLLIIEEPTASLLSSYPRFFLQPVTKHISFDKAIALEERIQSTDLEQLYKEVKQPNVQGRRKRGVYLDKIFGALVQEPVGYNNGYDNGYGYGRQQRRGRYHEYEHNSYDENNQGYKLGFNLGGLDFGLNTGTYDNHYDGVKGYDHKYRYSESNY